MNPEGSPESITEELEEARKRIAELEKELETRFDLVQMRRANIRIAGLEDLVWRLYNAIVTDSVHDGLPREIKDFMEKK